MYTPARRRHSGMAPHRQRDALHLLVLYTLIESALSHQQDEACAAECPSGDCGDEHAAVRESKIAGAGLGAFALRQFAIGETVGYYWCTVVPARASNGLYAWTLNSTHVCDGEQHHLQNPMRYVNSVAHFSSCEKQNVRAPKGLRPGQLDSLSYVASRPIAAGDELITDYGEDYFKQSSAMVAAGVL